jgi:hypothetical protein
MSSQAAPAPTTRSQRRLWKLLRALADDAERAEYLTRTDYNLDLAWAKNHAGELAAPVDAVCSTYGVWDAFQARFTHARLQGERVSDSSQVAILSEGSSL